VNHQLYGMHWASDLPLGLPEVAAQEPDLVLTLGPPAPVAPGAPPGEVLAHLPDRFTFARDGDVVRLRFHGLCEFTVTGDRAEVRLAPGVDEGYVPVLATGMLATVVLVLGGRPVLHGSAVALGDGAVAFVGASGMGKSTLSSLLCQAGAGLITDDVLRVDLPDLRCRNGAVESRLRADPEVGEVRRTADGRAALTSSRLAPDRVPLRVVAVPYPSREVDEVRAEWLAPAAALVELLRFPRIVGWVEPVSTAAHFGFVADLVRQVPVARLLVPWRTRPGPELADAVRAALADPVRPPPPRRV
jgi:hypothetical protein